MIADSFLKWEALYVVPFGLLPLFIASFFPQLNPLGLAGLTVCFFPWILRRWRRGYFTRRTPFDLAILIFLLGATVGLYAAVQPEVAIARMLNLLGVVLGFYMVVNTASGRSLRLYFLLLPLASVGFILLILSQVASVEKYFSSGLVSLLRPGLETLVDLPKFPWPIYEDQYPFHPSFLRFLALVIPHTVIFTFWGRRTTRIASGLLTCLFAFALLLTSMRGSLLAVIAGLAVMAFYWKPQAILGLPVAALAAYGLLLSPLVGKTETTLEMLSNPATFSRLDLWRVAWWVMQDFPYTGSGLGLGNWYRVFPLYGMLYFGPEPPSIHVHNFFLQTYIEQGVLGFIGLLSMVMVAFWMAWRLRRQTQGFSRVLVLGSIGSFAALLVSSLTDSMPSTPVGTLLFFGPLAMIAAVACIARPEAAVEGSPPRPEPLA